MEVFRISRREHADNLNGSGASGRWNMNGEKVIYTGQSRSLATLELVVNRNSISIVNEYLTLIISIEDQEDLYHQIKIKDLPRDWQFRNQYSRLQAIGSEWNKSRKTLILQVPSAVIPQEFNYIINTAHPAFSNHVTLVRTENYKWDERLL